MLSAFMRASNNAEPQRAGPPALLLSVGRCNAEPTPEVSLLERGALRNPPGLVFQG